MAGVLAEAVGRLRSANAEIDQAIVGPAIGPECYEFSEHDLAVVCERFGSGVRGRTSAGRPALNLRAGISSALDELGIEGIRHVGGCTACSGHGFSHRADGDPRRLALVAWIEARR
jgi:copper oxidase (laccase) domain-containing protein